MTVTTVFDHLESEWRTLARDRAAARQLATVRATAGDAADLAGVEAHVRAATPPEADRVLLALVAPAIDADQLAARVLVQLLLPGTRRLANRWWALGDHDERVGAATEHTLTTTHSPRMTPPPVPGPVTCSGRAIAAPGTDRATRAGRRRCRCRGWWG